MADELGEMATSRGEATIVSVSMSALASAWKDEWWPAIPNPTLLADAHPFMVTEVLKLLRSNLDPDPAAACAGWRVQRNDDGSHVTGAYLRLSDPADDDDPGLITVFVTTTTVALELLELWRDPSTFDATEDDPLHPRLPPFATLLGNLAEEEPWFDFDAFRPEPLPTE